MTVEMVCEGVERVMCVCVIAWCICSCIFQSRREFSGEGEQQCSYQAVWRWMKHIHNVVIRIQDWVKEEYYGERENKMYKGSKSEKVWETEFERKWQCKEVRNWEVGWRIEKRERVGHKVWERERERATWPPSMRACALLLPMCSGTTRLLWYQSRSQNIYFLIVYYWKQ